MTTQLPVLIVGAGPSGLMMALALHHQGVPFRIIEKRANPTETSNAAAIHSRTLEMLDDLSIVHNFLKQGQRIEYFNIHRGEKRLARIPTSQLNSRYNFVLTIPQSITEKILNFELTKTKNAIERETALTKIEQVSDGIIATLINKEKETETIHCRYLIACDGAHSTARNLLSMPFNGIDIPQQFILGDVEINESYPDNEISVYFHEDGPFAVFPFRKARARIVGTITKNDRSRQQPVSLNELQQLADKRSLNHVTVKDAYWTSTFWIHSKMLSKFRQNNIFFVGDSAHIHSPVGGQGMNTGMQDAYNLAWKLALTIQKNAKQILLDSYNEEREQNASALLKNTERMTKMMLVKNRFLQWIESKLISFLANKRHLQHAMITEMSMLGLHYEKSPIINYEYHVHSKGPLPGHRAPDVFFTDQNGPKRLNDLLKTTRHTLLIFTGIKTHDRDIAPLQALQQWGLDHNAVINPIIIQHPHVRNEFSSKGVLDQNSDLHIAYRADRPCFYLVRPDNYIGCCSSDLNLDLLKKYWMHLLN